MTSLIGTVSANPVKDVGVRTANQILNKCDSNWIPGDCIFKAYLAYKVANKAMDIKSFEIKRSYRIRKLTRSNTKKLFRLTPYGRAYTKFKKLYRAVK